MNSTPKFWKQWLIAVFVLTVIAVIVWLGFPQLSEEYYRAYYVQTCGPRLQKQLGFKAVFGRHEKYGYDAFFISTVDKGGVFDRAGIKPGFMPLLFRGDQSGFYSELEDARGGKTTLRFIEAAPDGKDIIHTIDIEVPLN